MRRHRALPLVFVACLIPGALLNAAVAWTLRYAAVFCASEKPQVHSQGEAAAAKAWPGVVPTDWPPVDGYVEWRWLGGRVRIACHGHFIRRFRTEAGWPFPSLRGDYAFPADEPAFRALRQRQIAVIDEVVLCYTIDGKGIIDFPLRPIMPGLVAGSVFYGGLLTAGSIIPGILRRAVRRRRGHCEHCGYDLRGGSGGLCPECGRLAKNGAEGVV